MMDKQRKVKVAQVGVGYWGPNLLRNLVASRGFSVKTVVDSAPERRAYVQSQYPAVQALGDAAAVADDPEIEAVVLATPVATHFDLAALFLSAGKHVLVEKPLCRTVEEVRRIKALAEAKRLVAMVGHTFLYNPAVRHLKTLVDSGALGQVRYIYSQRLNLGRIRSDVDALWNLAPHDISIIQYLLDDLEPTEVRRTGMDFVQPGVDDVVFLNLAYPSKVLAQVHVSWLDPHKVRQTTVVGSQKMAVYDDMADNKIAIYDKGIDRLHVLGENMDYDGSRPPRFHHRSGDVHMPYIPWREPLEVELEHFHECITGGVPCLTGPDHAEKVVRILACNEAAGGGDWSRGAQAAPAAGREAVRAGEGKP